MIQGSAQNRNRWYKIQHKIAELPSRLVALLNTAKATWNYCKRTKTMEKTTTILYQILNQETSSVFSYTSKKHQHKCHECERVSKKQARNARRCDSITPETINQSLTHWLTERGNKLNILEMLNTKLIPCSSRADCCGRPGPTCLGKILQAREHYSAEVNNILQYFGMLWHV